MKLIGYIRISYNLNLVTHDFFFVCVVHLNFIISHLYMFCQVITGSMLFYGHYNRLWVCIRTCLKNVVGKDPSTGCPIVWDTGTPPGYLVGHSERPQGICWQEALDRVSHNMGHCGTPRTLFGERQYVPCGGTLWDRTN